MNIINSFVYCWTDHLTNKLYVGSHKGTPDDGYVCSSKVMMKEYKARPGDFTRQIVAEGSYSDIRNLESTILNSVEASTNDDFYNMSNGNSKFYNTGPLSDNHKRKLSESLMGRSTGPRSEETKQKMRKPKSGEHRKKFMGNKNSAGVVKSAETIEKTRLANTGKKRDGLSIENLKAAQKRRYSDPKQHQIQSDAAKLGWITRRRRLMNVN